MTGEEAKKARRALAAMFGANGFIMGAWTPQIPELLPRHGIEEGAFGGLIFILGIGALCAMMYSGRMLSRYGSLTLLKLSSLLLIPALPLVVFAPNLPLLAAAMFTFGALVGFMDVIMNANAVEVERRLGRAIMSSSHGFWSLGGFFGGTTGSWLLSTTSTHFQSLVVAAIAALMVLLAWQHLRGEPPQPVLQGESATRGPLFPKEIAVWILGVMALFSMVPEGAVMDWAALYLRQELGATSFTSGLAYAFFAGTMAIVRFAGDGLRNRFGGVRMLRLSGFCAAAGLLIAAVAPHSAVALLGFAVAGLGVANLVPIIFSAAGNQPGQDTGRTLAAVTMVGYAGILVAPASIGFIAERIGFSTTYIALAGLLIVVSLAAKRASAADGR